MLKNIFIKENIKYTLILTIFITLIWSLLSGLLMGIFGFVKEPASNSSDSLKSLLYLFLLCFFNSIMVIWYTKRSHYSGKKLFINILILIWGIFSFMTQIETLYFNKAIQMPTLMILITVFTSAIIAIFSGIFAIKIKNRTTDRVKNEYTLNLFSINKNIGKFIFLSFLYVVFYFFFGYFIAWQFPALRQFYSGSTNILPFWTHMLNQVNQDAFLIVFQIFRGFLWSLIGYILLKGLSVKNEIERYILMGLLLSVPLAIPLVVPNDFMPPAIRFGHFFELLIENFLFGVILTYVFPSSKN
ncbi:hypothetical protein psyc5s11_05980 [Clostridium gelidum]|uniref:Uncharacterized protein n=1 Tax=Clostridium gelidum TaxID=704125 RepID=A0ABN6ISD0_9CLOT|nr:hypothetical protein [Clostridium gelidum]BCZ44531.1 hypothetical protein psyc5s11_05980 [Clostridium gelidum]